MTFDELNAIAKYDEFYDEKKMGMISLQIPPDLASGDYICVDRDGNRRASVHPIRVHRLYLGTRKDADMYGIMVVIAEYNGSFYRFHYRVCNKKTQGVYKMKFVKGIEVKRKDGVPFIGVRQDGFGRQTLAYDTRSNLILFPYGSDELSLLTSRLKNYCFKDKTCYELVHGVKAVKTRRGMHTDGWIEGETWNDRKKTFGFSLRQEEYPLPMIRLTFGGEYIPIPQNRAAIMILSRTNYTYPLKNRVYGAWCFVAAEELGISDEEVLKTYEDGRIPDGSGSDAERAIFAWIEDKIKEDGPYVVLERAMWAGYDFWCDDAGAYRDNSNVPFDGVIGEKQEWEKE